MAPSRVDQLKAFLEQDPRDCFARYGLALEYLKADDLEAAIREFETLATRSPEYVPTYYHAGKAYERAGRPEDARRMYRLGIEASEDAGDMHAKAELVAALEELEGETSL